ncbi:MAG: hypothetical protein JWL94_76 [Microbacteriaceae bacterium]|jgi:hypothetical protein|nr:hypothetical protein [Microbacteriaceae bacterium]HEV7956990.1 hypothetical protein [Marisediminicola sp.]
MTDTTASGSTRDPLSASDFDKQTITNDAVGGEPVNPTGHYAGPTGSEPLEAEPTLPDNELAGENIDLRDEQ